MKYIKELDGIRGIGILLVVAFHWIPVDDYYDTFPNRPFGVDVFFVLSGFLITHILLTSRLGAETAGIPSRYVFTRFFTNRALRIFPVYFLVIAIILICHSWLGAGLESDLLPALTFTLNFHFYDHQYWGDLTTHLWTLSVEEQFYAVWPWLMVCVNKKYLPHVILFFTSIGVISQLLITDKEFGYLPTYTCFDAFGIGAWLAWVKVFQSGKLAITYRALRVAGAVSLAVLIAGAIFPDLIFLSPQRTLRSLVAAWAIGYVLYKDHNNTLYKMPIFGNRFLCFVGKISYGMYLYHLFLPWMYFEVNHPINKFLPRVLDPYLFPITIVENFIMLIAVSWCSYKFFELPIMKIKRVFDSRITAGSMEIKEADVKVPAPANS